MDKVYDILSRYKSFQEIEKIEAQVPIIKLKDKKTEICADIVFNRDDGITGSLVAATCTQLYPELRPLYFVLKAFLRER